MDTGATHHLIRPYRPADRQAVRDICAATCWMGEHRPDLIPDGWIWAEYWTRYFTDVEPRHSWVVQNDPSGQVAGYLNGTCDVRRFDAYAWRLVPGVVWHAIRKRLMRRPVSRRAILSMLRAMFRGELELPPGVARKYPATWHFNLLPGVRGGGLGWQLFCKFREAMRSLGVPGLHSQPMSINPQMLKFLTRAGFALVSSKPTCAFAHVEPRPIEVQTWVLPLEP